YRDVRRIPVHIVVRRELIMPPQLARVRIEGDHRIAVEIVSKTQFRVSVWISVPSTPIGQVEIRVIRAGIPYSGAASLPRIARPCFIPRFTGSGNRGKAPDSLPCCDIEG